MRWGWPDRPSRWRQARVSFLTRRARVTAARRALSRRACEVDLSEIDRRPARRIVDTMRSAAIQSQSMRDALLIVRLIRVPQRSSTIETSTPIPRMASHGSQQPQIEIGTQHLVEP